MQFLTHYKISESLSNRTVQTIAEGLTAEGAFPPESVEILRWDATPDYWGVLVWEADDYQAVNDAVNVWRAAADEEAFFEETTTAPAAPVEEILQHQAALLEQLE